MSAERNYTCIYIYVVAITCRVLTSPPVCVCVCVCVWQVSKGKQELSFFSLPEFECWKAETDNSHTWRVKYYKGSQPPADAVLT